MIKTTKINMPFSTSPPECTKKVDWARALRQHARSLHIALQNHTLQAQALRAQLLQLVREVLRRVLLVDMAKLLNIGWTIQQRCMATRAREFLLWTPTKGGFDDNSPSNRRAVV
jgi:hypothetical protein